MNNVIGYKYKVSALIILRKWDLKYNIIAKIRGYLITKLT